MADYVLTEGDIPESESGNIEILPTEQVGEVIVTKETRTDGTYCGCGVTCTSGCGASCTGTNSNSSIGGFVSRVSVPTIARERFSGVKIF